MPPLRNSCAMTKIPINIVILGAASVGKTAVTLQFITEKKVDTGNSQPTIEDSFFKELKMNDSVEVCDSVFKEDGKDQGTECLWKMDVGPVGRKNSAGSTQHFRMRNKRKNSNNNEIEETDFKAMVKVTDTAGFKPVYASRKTLKHRLASRLAPRRAVTPLSPEPPVRRRYRHNIHESPKHLGAVPSFIYRMVDGKSTIHDSLMRTADAFILVYSVQDNRSFETLQQIRSQILSARGSSCASPDEILKTNRRFSSPSIIKGIGKTGTTYLPPIAVVGTHIDLTAPTISPCNVEPDTGRKDSGDSLLSYAFTFNPRRKESRKRILQKTASIEAEILSQTSKPRGPEVSAEYVRGVVGAWQECVGFAEVSNNNAARVNRVFEHLTSRVIRKRLSGAKHVSLPSSPARKRLDSVLSGFIRHSTAETNVPRRKSSGPFSCCFR